MLKTLNYGSVIREVQTIDFWPPVILGKNYNWSI